MKKGSLPKILNLTRSESIVCFGWIILTIIMITGCNSAGETSVQTLNPNGRNDSWGFTGYGGGGAMFNPAVSPHNENYAYVACDMTGSFVTVNGGESWRMFCLRGPVKYFVFDPVDSNTVYANSIGLFKSSDHGNTWKIFYPPASEISGVVQKATMPKNV